MNPRKTICVFVVLGLCVAAGATDRKYFAASADAKGLPFSGAVQANNTLYVSGQIGSKPGQSPPTAEQEARSLMETLKHTVESAGYSMDDLVSVQIFCTDMKLYDAFNGVYKTYFHDNFPARSFLGVNELVRGARFEVTGIAVKREP